MRLTGRSHLYWWKFTGGSGLYVSLTLSLSPLSTHHSRAGSVGSVGSVGGAEGDSFHLPSLAESRPDWSDRQLHGAAPCSLTALAAGSV